MPTLSRSHLVYAPDLPGSGALDGLGPGRRRRGDRAEGQPLRSLSLTGYGGLATAWGKSARRSLEGAPGRAHLRAPREWLKEQCRLARLPGFLPAQLDTARAQVGLRGSARCWSTGSSTCGGCPRSSCGEPETVPFQSPQGDPRPRKRLPRNPPRLRAPAPGRATQAVRVGPERFLRDEA